ncbi:MAG: adenylyl-sulfate kinase, partial [Alkaliphilus sp.]|nr:adenylyl-sulfate kinase [Alkaliphilus sp.]
SETKPEISTKIKTKLFWLGSEDLNSDRSYLLKIGTQKIKAELETVVYVLDAVSLATSNRQYVKRYEVAEVILKLDKEIAFDKAENIIETSRFVLVDNYEISGGGIIVDSLEEKNIIKENISIESLKWIESSISREERAIRSGQKPTMIILAGSKEINKKALAIYLEKKFFRYGRNVLNLNLEGILMNTQLDIERDNSIAERNEYISKFAEISSVLLYAGNILLAAINDLNQSDIEILNSIVDPKNIKIAWIGDAIDTNIPISLFLEENITKEKAYGKIKKMMIDHNFIFEPYSI